MSCACQRPTLDRLSVPPVPRATGALRVDRAALRKALGGRAEVTEVMGTAKASGRPGVNASVLWRYFTEHVYRSGDLPVLAVRELLQNGWDAVRAAIKARQIREHEARFDVIWDQKTRTLIAEDSGVGMDSTTILTRFLTLGESGKGEAADSSEAAGGFGVAKAVILGTSQSFRWRLHTRDNLAVSEGAGAEVSIFEAPFRQGTRIEIQDVSPDFDHQYDYARQAWVPTLERLRELLASNDLPGLRVTLNGEEIHPLFSRRGGSKVPVDGSWGAGSTATVKAYRRPPGDRQGGYYVRLNGLAQFKLPASSGRLKADIVVDLHTTVRPSTKGYPFTAARDALQEPAASTLYALQQEVEREDESVGRDQEDEVYDVESADPAEREEARSLAELTDDAFADPGFQAALADVRGAIADFYGEQYRRELKGEPVASAAPAATPELGEPAEPERPIILPEGLLPRAGPATEPDIDTARGAASLVAGFLATAEQARTAGAATTDPTSPRPAASILTGELRRLLDQAGKGHELRQADFVAVANAVESATETALAPGGGGLLQVAGVGRVWAALGQLAAPEVRVPAPKNPFGRLCVLRVSKKRFDRARARRFKLGWARFIPHLTLWDATLRLVAAEARLRRRFVPGFLLDDEVAGMAESRQGKPPVIYINPDKLAAVIKAHRERPIAIAAYVHGVAVHELTHLDIGLGSGHTEKYIVAREDLGAATAHLLPAIAILATRLLALPVKEGEDSRRVAKLERQLRAAQDALKRKDTDHKAARAELRRVQAELQRVRGPVDDAEALVDELEAGLIRSPPTGVTGRYMAAFFVRNRPRLLNMMSDLLSNPV